MLSRWCAMSEISFSSTPREAPLTIVRRAKHALQRQAPVFALHTFFQHEQAIDDRLDLLFQLDREGFNQLAQQFLIKLQRHGSVVPFHRQSLNTLTLSRRRSATLRNSFVEALLCCTLVTKCAVTLVISDMERAIWSMPTTS